MLDLEQKLQQAIMQQLGLPPGQPLEKTEINVRQAIWWSIGFAESTWSNLNYDPGALTQVADQALTAHKEFLAKLQEVALKKGWYKFVGLKPPQPAE